MGAYVTKECYDKCHQSKEKNINITDLQDGLILITKWSLEFVKASSEDFTNYHGIEMKMIIHDFSVKLGDQLKMSRYPLNLYRDDEVKAMMQNFVNEQRMIALQKVIENESAGNTARELNTINLGGHPSTRAAEDDPFTDFEWLVSKEK